MARRTYGWIYQAKAARDLDLYIGQHDGPNPFTRLAQHEKGDAEWMRHVKLVYLDDVNRDDLNHEEEIRIKSANNGDGTIFNNEFNGQRNVPYYQDYAERFYDGYSTRYDKSEVPSTKDRRDRKAAAEDHPSYVSRARRRRQRKKSG